MGLRRILFSSTLLILCAVEINCEEMRVLSRVKRDWSYPPFTIVETQAAMTSSFSRTPLFTIKSDNPQAKHYKLRATPPVVNGLFSIEDTGRLWQEEPVDREADASFVLYAEALDSAYQKVEQDVVLVINVTDQNDNQPVFVQSSLHGSVFENSLNEKAMTLQATDADAAGSPFYYGNVSFSYAGVADPAQYGSAFAVAPNGDVTIQEYLDREEFSTIKLVVMVKDGLPSGPGYTVSATATVTVLDTNDHAPVFTSPSPYTQSVEELMPVNTPFLTIAATDVDEGVNKAVYFRIDAGNINDQFTVRSNPSTEGESNGQIILNKPLDYEQGIREFTLTVIAYNKDSSNANDFTASTAIIITVIDENEPPIFLGTPYIGYITENLPNGKENVITVQAVDYDFGGQNVTYSIINNDGGANWFQISNAGVVSAVNPVDREDPAVNKTSSVYDLEVEASDGIKKANVIVAITIRDKNDEKPMAGSGWSAVMCEKPSEAMRRNITTIYVTDGDSVDNGAPFDISIVGESPFMLDLLSQRTGAIVMTMTTQFDAASINQYLVPIQLMDTPAAGESRQTNTQTLTVSICPCSDNEDDSNALAECQDSFVVPGGINIMVIVAIIAAILILLIIVLAVVAYRRRNMRDLEKQALFVDDDDVRENLQAYHDEGGGEEDNDGYDISALQAPPLIAPKRQDEPPLGGAEPQRRPMVPPDTDIGDYINDAKQQADNDPTAPPFDSLLVFDYEGQGSDAGSLSSLNSGTTDASQDYDYLNNWGPKFKKLTDMYGGGESD